MSSQVKLKDRLNDTVGRRSAFFVTIPIPIVVHDLGTQERPYRWVRHPYYVTTALLMTSLILPTADWMIGLGCFLVLGLLVVLALKKEQRLIDNFDQKYRDYMANTGRFFARFSGRK